MVKNWWLVFVLLAVNATLEEECGIWEHLHSFRELKWDRWSVKDPIFWFVLVKRIKRKGGSKISLCNPSDGKLFFRPSAIYDKLFDRVAFRILSNMNTSETLFFYPLLLSGISPIIIFKIRNRLVLLKNKSLNLSEQVLIVRLVCIILMELNYLQD